ncbi:alpha-2-HS-glycoprotein [Sceloporus undulatus]|uniref:alpha-2-HS-glycoprotein n=1 Tax=Sceloporus undulatus TaxID=8520 RepID=UPI001C4D7A9A|nr:alpha-2-HS-glycoprotein [Sceloporus undulatus]
MKSLVALVLLGQILGSITTSPPFPPLNTRLPACDDPEVEHAAAFAVHHINTHTLHGYKIALNRIESVKVLPRRPKGDMYYLEMDLLETTCHVLDPLPAANCTVRSKMEHAVEADCDVKLLSLDGNFKVLSTKCHSSPDSAEDLRKICPDCTPISKLNDIGVVNAVDVALSEFNARNDTNHYYKLLEISRGKHTHLPPASHVEFAIVATNCTAQEAKDHIEDCHLGTGEHVHFGFCKATIFDRTVAGPADAKFPPGDAVDCTIFDQQAGFSHTHLTEHHLGKKIPSPGVGHTVLDLIHSHNDTHASHESHSAEVAVVEVASPVVKRAVDPVPVAPILPVLQQCPGKYHHFKI